MTPKTEPVLTRFDPGVRCQVVEVHYKAGNLSITIEGENQQAVVVFQTVYGHRVLDEQDLLEFWPGCALNNGWLYEVFKGGWKDLESSREGAFVTGQRSNVLEFLVVSEDTCVSVLSYHRPVVNVSPTP